MIEQQALAVTKYGRHPQTLVCLKGSLKRIKRCFQVYIDILKNPVLPGPDAYEDRRGCQLIATNLIAVVISEWCTAG